ncbi:type II toxin-antitoxin system antitoxin SocA domain-containing protein [Escherichia coli]
MAYLKLMKLLYLSNRQSILKHGRMIGEDSLYSMKFGPVMSNTLNLIRGKAEGIGDYWYNLIETNGIMYRCVQIRGKWMQTRSLMN